MANMKGPRFKLCRSLGLNVVGHPKAMSRAGKGTSRADRKLSNYGEQLLEKQKLRAYYGVMEKQFARYVNKAMKSEGIAGDALVSSLEKRLDNMVYRMGFASSIRQARQMVSHGHMRVNGKKVDRPSYQLDIGDQVSLREKSRQVEIYKDNLDSRTSSFPYIDLQVSDFSARLVSEPERSDIPVEINDTLIIEFYTK